MSDDAQAQLRQIKWLLAAILACLVVIVFAVVPGLFTLTLALVLTTALAVILWTLSRNVRVAVRRAWRQVARRASAGR